MASKIIGVETATPANCMTQQEVLDSVRSKLRISNRGMELYEKFLLDDGIHTRYFGWEDIDVLLVETPDEKIKRFERVSVDLATQALKGLLIKFNRDKKDIDAIFISTCTGYLCPGLTSYVVEQLKLKQDIYAVDLVGMGCGGAIPALRAADDYLRSHPNSNAIVISVEVCTAAIHWREEVELILSNSIFSDGAAAVFVTNEDDVTGFEIRKISSLLWPQYRDQLRFKHLDARLCNVISPKVPVIAGKAAVKLYQDILSNLQSTYYAMHLGGRKVLDTIQKSLDLQDEEMSLSRSMLRKYGNMSSPSVLFVLKEILHRHQVKKAETAALFSFGAGFTAFGLLAEWT